jgi:hypothetical protein
MQAVRRADDTATTVNLCRNGHDRDVVGTYVAPGGHNHGCLACKRKNSNTRHERTARRRLVERRANRKRATARDLTRLEELLGSTTEDRSAAR